MLTLLVLQEISDEDSIGLARRHPVEGHLCL